MNKNIFRAFAILLTLPLIILGYIGWFGPFLGGALFPNEVPIGHCLGVVVDHQNRIYLGEGFYGKIQVYDSEGNFLKGWPVDAAGGVFRMRLSDQNKLEVATVRTNRLLTYDANGQLLETKENVGRDLYDEWSQVDECKYQDREGNLYEYQNILTFPRVIKTSPTGHKSVIVSTSIRQWLFTGPFPAWLFGATGIGLMFFAFGNVIFSLKKN